MKFQSSSNSMGAPNRLSSKAWALVNARGLLAQAGFPWPFDSATITQTDSWRRLGAKTSKGLSHAWQNRFYFDCMSQYTSSLDTIKQLYQYDSFPRFQGPNFRTIATRKFWDWDSGQSSAKSCNDSGLLLYSWNLYDQINDLVLQ